MPSEAKKLRASIELTKAPISGLDVLRGTFGFIFQNESRLTHDFFDLLISGDGTQAVAIGAYALDIDEVGAKADETFLFVLKRYGENWDIVVDIFN